MTTGPTQPAKPAAVDSAPADARFGKFVRLEKLGRGGMGEVWKAWDSELNRFVALKFLLADDPDEIARFKREAQTAGRLTHPNIAAIHDVGQDQGRHFIAMQFVQGQTLRTAPRNDERELVRLVRDAAVALQHAHSLGIVHRDLKPENLMIEGARVYVMDFGLARQVQAAHSTSGMAVGTPAYMPPEQARGLRADERSDVYGLGATLYELLTDRPPFQGADVYALLMKVIEEEPKRPRAIKAKLDAEIETIVLKCIEKDPARRYGSAGALANDLDRWLKGEAIEAHPPSAFYRLRKAFAKRKAVLSVALAGAALAGVVAAITIPNWFAKERELAALKELGALWSEIVLAKQGFYRAAADPAKVRQKIRDVGERVTAYITRYPGHPQGYYVRARGSLYLNELSGAEADLRKAIELDPTFAPGEALLGRVLLEQYVIRLYGTRETADERIRAAKPILDEAQAHLAKGWTRGAQRRSIETWGLLKTREDEVAEAVIPALLAAYGDGKQAEGARLLREAWAREPSEEYANWLGLWSKEIHDVIRWQTEALTLMPHYAKALLDRGIARSILGATKEAIADIMRAIDLEPRSIAAHVCLIVVRHREGDLDGAVAECTVVIELSPQSARAWAERASMRQRKHDYDGAIADSDKALSLDPALATALVTRGIARFRKGDVDGAMTDVSKAIGIDPKNAYAFSARAALRGRQGNREGELDDCRYAIELDPKCTDAYVTRSAARLVAGDFVAAIEDASEAIALNPRSADAYVNRANGRGRTGDVDGALQDAEAALRIDPAKSEAWSTRGTTRAMKGNLDGGAEDSAKALALDPLNSNAYATRGAIRDMRGDPDGAIEDATRAIELDPRRAEWHVNRSTARLKKGDLDRALADAQTAIDLAPRLALGWFNRGLARERKGDLDGALADWNSAIELEPAHAIALNNRASIKFRRGDFAGAIEDNTKAIQANPRYAEAWYDRGLARAQTRELDGAIDDYTKAIAINPSYPEAYANRGGLYGYRGQDDLAIADFKKALEMAPTGWSYRTKVEGMLKSLQKK